MTSDTNDLKNIKYKNMFLSDNTSHINSDSSGINTILDNECKASKVEPWSKLNKTMKIEKINDYVDSLIIENNLSEEEVEALKNYMLNCLDRKKLQCVKDVIYDKTTGIIKSIPCLVFNKTTRKFTLKRSEKRVSTLKSLGPGKTRKKATSANSNNKNRQTAKASSKPVKQSNSNKPTFPQPKNTQNK